MTDRKILDYVMDLALYKYVHNNDVDRIMEHTTYKIDQKIFIYILLKAAVRYGTNG